MKNLIKTREEKGFWAVATHDFGNTRVHRAFEQGDNPNDCPLGWCLVDTGLTKEQALAEECEQPISEFYKSKC
jgi:hypothetical protein